MLDCHTPVFEMHSANNFAMKEKTPVAKINLRGNLETKEFPSKIGKILGIILPKESCSTSSNENITSLWLGPNEWLITNNQNLYKNLKNELGDIQASVTDVSENRTVIRISGDQIFKLLSKFLVLDLEKNLPDESSCAQTLFVKVPVLLVRNNNEKQIPEIDIFTNRSHAKYIYNLIVDGSQYLDF